MTTEPQSLRAGDGIPELPPLPIKFPPIWVPEGGCFKDFSIFIREHLENRDDEWRTALAAAPAAAPAVEELAESLAKRSLELAMANAELDAVRSLLWDDFPECCGVPDVTDHGIYGREQHCCGCPEPVKLNDAQIVASLRAQFKEPVQAPATGEV